MIKEGKLKLRATDLHEMLRCWENNHRVLAAEAHLKPIQFREERRYPDDDFRAAFLDMGR